MFQEEELQNIIVFAIRAAKGRGARGRKRRIRERSKRWGRGLSEFIFL